MREPEHGFRLLIIVLMSCALIIADQRSERFGNIKSRASFIVYPIQKIVDLPIATLHEATDFLVAQQRLVNENNYLKQEQILQQAKLQRLSALETENQQLRQLTQTGSQVTDNLLIANIINVDPDPFTHQVIIDKGRHDNVYPGQTIIDANGIMGTVSAVNDFDSRAILITDASHAVPVEDVRNGLRAIAVGTGSGCLELRHVPNTTDIAVGDIMITSGLGGRFPVGFPVGVVKDVQHEPGKPFASITLNPSAKLDRGRHILLLQNKDKRHNGGDIDAE